MVGAQLGVARCAIHRVFQSGAAKVLVPAHLGMEILNPFPNTIPANAWILVTRDKYGRWFLISPNYNTNTEDATGTGSPYTGTGTNSGSYPGYYDLVSLYDICPSYKYHRVDRSSATGTGTSSEYELGEYDAFVAGSKRVVAGFSPKYISVRIPNGQLLASCIGITAPCCPPESSGTGTGDLVDCASLPGTLFSTITAVRTGIPACMVGQTIPMNQISDTTEVSDGEGGPYVAKTWVGSLNPDCEGCTTLACTMYCYTNAVGTRKVLVSFHTVHFVPGDDWATTGDTDLTGGVEVPASVPFYTEGTATGPAHGVGDTSCGVLGETANDYDFIITETSP